MSIFQKAQAENILKKDKKAQTKKGTPKELYLRYKIGQI